MTRTDSAVDRLFPLRQPEPRPGCDACAGLAEQRAEAEAGRDYSRVVDCNIRIRRHAHNHQPIRR